METRSQWRNPFYFSKAERNGITVLCVVLSVIMGVRFYFLHQQRPPLNIVITPMEVGGDRPDSLPVSTMKKKEPQVQFVSFDPNQVTYKELKRMPLSPSQIRSLLGFRKAGGRFLFKQDVQRLRGMDSVTYSLMEDYIRLPERKAVEITPGKKVYAERRIEVVDINSADSATLESLPGIGAYLASRIVRYRKNLGGYNNPEQLLEIRNFRTETMEQIRPFLKVTKCEPCKLNVNMSDEKTLGNQPYIGFQLARRIVQYRSQHGNFKALEELLKVAGITPEIFQKLSPHLRVD